VSSGPRDSARLASARFRVRPCTQVNPRLGLQVGLFSNPSKQQSLVSGSIFFPSRLPGFVAIARSLPGRLGDHLMHDLLAPVPGQHHLSHDLLLKIFWNPRQGGQDYRMRSRAYSDFNAITFGQLPVPQGYTPPDTCYWIPAAFIAKKCWSPTRGHGSSQPP